MFLRNCLFCLSFILIVGCTKESDNAACSSRLDSLAVIHQHATDSLGTMIQAQQSKIEEMEQRHKAVLDSLGKLPPSKKGPDIPADQPKGIPIDFGGK